MIDRDRIKYRYPAIYIIARALLLHPYAWPAAVCMSDMTCQWFSFCYVYGRLISRTYIKELDPVFFYFPSVRVQTYVLKLGMHAILNQERSTKTLWNIASRMCGEGSEHIKSTKKWLCQNSVAYAKTPWNATKVRGSLDLPIARNSSMQLHVSCTCGY